MGLSWVEYIRFGKMTWFPKISPNQRQITSAWRAHSNSMLWTEAGPYIALLTKTWPPKEQRPYLSPPCWHRPKTMVEGICYLASLITSLSKDSSFQIQFMYIEYSLYARYLGRLALPIVYYIDIFNFLQWGNLDCRMEGKHELLFRKDHWILEGWRVDTGVGRRCREVSEKLRNISSFCLILRLFRDEDHFQNLTHRLPQGLCSPGSWLLPFSN